MPLLRSTIVLSEGSISNRIKTIRIRYSEVHSNGGERQYIHLEGFGLHSEVSETELFTLKGVGLVFYIARYNVGQTPYSHHRWYN